MYGLGLPKAFGTPYIVSGMGKATDSKFRTHIHIHRVYQNTHIYGAYVHRAVIFVIPQLPCFNCASVTFCFSHSSVSECT